MGVRTYAAVISAPTCETPAVSRIQRFPSLVQRSEEKPPSESNVQETTVPSTGSQPMTWMPVLAASSAPLMTYLRRRKFRLAAHSQEISRDRPPFFDAQLPTSHSRLRSCSWLDDDGCADSRTLASCH